MNRLQAFEVFKSHRKKNFLQILKYYVFKNNGSAV